MEGNVTIATIVAWGSYEPPLKLFAYLTTI